MTDRNDSDYGLDTIFRDLTKTSDAMLDDIASADVPLIRLTRKPTMTAVPRPHNAAVLARSAFANANLPVVNVHARTKKLDVRGH